MGGPERVERLLHERGKLDARQRIAHLFDPERSSRSARSRAARTFPADALVAGFGKIDGRTAFAGAETSACSAARSGSARCRSATGSASSRARSACRSCSCSTARAIV
jgi:acetyl-CoA carboxylase carboxyltransferase component